MFEDMLIFIILFQKMQSIIVRMTMLSLFCQGGFNQMKCSIESNCSHPFIGTILISISFG